MIESTVVARVVYSGVTLYMMLILLRWLAPRLNVEMGLQRYRWVTTVTDPPITFVRRYVPALGPWDWAPLATVLLLWLCRTLFISSFLPR